MGAVIPLESIDKDEHHMYQTSFEDHPEGEGIIVKPRSILSIRIERAEVSSSHLLSSPRLRVFSLMMPR